MNTFPNSTPFRKQIIPEKVFSLNNKLILTNPREDSSGELYVCNECSELISFNKEGNFSTFLTLGGMPKCITFGPDDKSIYIADSMNKVVYEKPIEKNKEVNFIFRDYSGIALKGPTSIIKSKDNDFLLVTDTGNFGSSTITNPNGSIYLFDLNNNVLRPIILNNLAYPCDIYYDKEEEVFYVAEMLNNRILRLVQSPKGIFHASVFYQFNGRLGPSAIAMDEIGNIYISRSEFFEQNKKNNNGIISIITKEGNLIGEIVVEGYSEINGMLIPKNDGKLKRKISNISENISGSEIYFTDRNFPGVLRIKLSNISQEIDKILANKY